jgi:flagellar hook assembly protein FlgD
VDQPNPARAAAVIPFDLPVRESVKLEIYDAQGRRVWKQTGRYEAGRYRVEWDLRTQQGARVTPGVYAYRLIAGPFRDEHKLVVLP